MEDLANCIVSETRLLELLLHKNKIVRDEAVDALERYFPNSPTAIKQILKAFRTYPNESTRGLLASLKSFLPDAGDLQDILKILVEHTGKKDENSINIYFHLISSLYQFSFELIAAQQESLLLNEKLQKNYEILSNRQQMKSRPPQILWTELKDICKENQGKDPSDNASQYVDLLVEGLLQYRDEIIPKIIMSLRQTSTDDHLDLYLVRLAGQLRLRETIPDLFRILKESDFMALVNDQCIDSLGKIGGPEVVRQVQLLYPGHQEIRPQLVSILKWIPYDDAEELALGLLENETDFEQKTLLAEALCGMFSLKAAEPIKKIIETQQYDPAMAGLVELLIPVYEYHQQTYDLSALQRKEQQFFQEKTKTDPWHQAMATLTNTLDQMVDSQNQRKKIGRNDPCPCGSGKKYKKCCLGKG